MVGDDKKERLSRVASARKRDKNGRFLPYEKIKHRCPRCDIGIEEKETRCKWCISEGY